MLKTPFFIDVDIDECKAEVADCAELCFNTEGSFYCACNNAGYEVVQTNETCKGMQTNTQVQL